MSKTFSTSTEDILRRSGIDGVGEVPWGTHLCQLYESKKDLVKILIPYFAQGLKNNEFCLWLTSTPLEVEEAKKALTKTIPNLNAYLQKGQLEIISANNWQIQKEKTDTKLTLHDLIEKEQSALKNGFEGIRIASNDFKVENTHWQDHIEFAETLNKIIDKHKMLILCTYYINNYSSKATIDIMAHHVGTLIKQADKWILIENVLKRKKAEQIIKKSEERTRQQAEELQKLLDIIPVAVWISRDPKCNHIVGNQTANSFYEAEKDENVSAGPTTGKEKNTTRRFFKNGKELKPEQLPMQEAAAKNKQIRNSEIEVLKPSGKTMTMIGNAKPLIDKKGKVRGSLAAFLDITERKKAQEALIQAQQKLQEYTTSLEKIIQDRTNELKDAERLVAIGQTAGMVGHDIRNPLQGIISDVFLAKIELDSITDNQQKQNILENLNAIEENVTYINKIVQDLQDFARPVQVTLKKIRLKEILNELLIKTEIPDNITASHQIDKKVDHLISDPEILQRIIGNLIINAIQAMPKGGELNLTATPEADDIVIAVTDTGTGIPDEIKPKIFTPLFTTKSKGQGFGLAVVKRMTELLGGHVSYQTEIGKGTTFTIRLPKKQQK